MRMLHLTLVGALVAVPLAFIGSEPANAAQRCPCSQMHLPSGTCTQYGICEELLQSADTLVPFRNTRACRRTQALLCEFQSCKVVCAPKKT